VIAHPSLQSLISIVVTGIDFNESFILTPEMHILLFASGSKAVYFRKPSENSEIAMEATDPSHMLQLGLSATGPLFYGAIPPT